MSEQMAHLSHSEKEIIRRIVTDALAAGYRMTVYDGEEKTVRGSTDRKEILDAIGTTDSDTLGLWNGEKRMGGIMLVYGNEPGVVVADYSASLSDFMTPINTFAETFA